MKAPHPIPRLLVLTTLLLILFSPVQRANAQGTFTYLDDGAEIGGYDVTADMQKLPAELMLAQQENNDGYLLRVTPENIELALYQSGKRQVLAQARTQVRPGPLVVQRRGAHWNFITGNRIALQAEDERWQEGRIGFRGGLKGVRVQPVEEINFDDDFMRIAEEVAMEKARENPTQGVKVSDVKTPETVWTPLLGTWSTTGLSENAAAQVAQSANPFAFKSGLPGANLAVAGRAFWSDYEASVSVKPQGATAIGLAVYVQDARHYLLLHWQQKGPIQLRAVTVTGDGASQVRVLDEAMLEPNGGYEQKQWYRLRLAVASGVLRAYVDDIEVLRARTGYFGRGQVAVYSENPNTESYATFDDVSVRSISDIYDDFATPVQGRWQTRSGTWKLAGTATPQGAATAIAVLGDAQWQNYTASADINLPADAAAGLVLNHQQNQGSYTLRVTGSRAKSSNAGTVQILRMRNGKTEVLSEKKIGIQYDNRVSRWSFTGEGGYLRGSVDDNGKTRTIVDAFDELLPDGRAGLYAQRGMQGTPQLSAFAVEFPRARTTWAKVPDLYELERQAETMGGWSTPEGLWAASNPLDTRNGAPANSAATPVPGTAAAGSATPANKILWHKGAFWGDDSIRFKLPKLSPGQAVILVFGDGRHAGSQSLGLQLEGDILKASLASVNLSGSEVKTGAANAGQRGQIKIAGAVDAQIVEVTRRGSFLLVRAGTAENLATLIAARVYK